MHTRVAPAFCIGLVLALFIGCGGCNPGGSIAARNPASNGTTADPRLASKGAKRDLAAISDADLAAQIGRQVDRFCGYCHPVPTPDLAPREAWHTEVKEGFEFHANSPRKDQPTPDMEMVVEFFRRRALPGDQVVVPERHNRGPGRVKFRRQAFASRVARAPAVAGIQWLTWKEGPALLISDMRYGELFRLRPSRVDRLPPPIAKVDNPCRANVCDLDRDGLEDLVVADLGKFLPSDARLGRVIWLRRLSTGEFENVELAWGLGRVADVQPGDFDGDGDTDLIVAEFGFHEAGQVVYLENVDPRLGAKGFVQTTVDPRHGCITVPTVDFNRDGHLDFVALFGQEFEMVDLFLNRGDGTFRNERLHHDPRPSYGSSAIELVDLDADGDLDVVYANGDGFDRRYLKPYHSVQWLENKGEFPFTHHHLTYMPGCHRAVAGDLDRDGDLDIVAVALLPDSIRKRHGSESFDSLIWLEQTGPREFVRHELETGACDHATMEMADFDGDGDLDVATGNLLVEELNFKGLKSDPLEVWWNETPAKGDAKQPDAGAASAALDVPR